MCPRPFNADTWEIKCLMCLTSDSKEASKDYHFHFVNLANVVSVPLIESSKCHPICFACFRFHLSNTQYFAHSKTYTNKTNIFRLTDIIIFIAFLWRHHYKTAVQLVPRCRHRFLLPHLLTYLTHIWFHCFSKWDVLGVVHFAAITIIAMILL